MASKEEQLNAIKIGLRNKGAPEEFLSGLTENSVFSEELFQAFVLQGKNWEDSLRYGEQMQKDADARRGK